MNPPTLLVVHAHWSGERLHLWAESSALLEAPPSTRTSEVHPFVVPPERIQALLDSALASAGESSILKLRLPALDGVVLPSPTLDASHINATRVDMTSEDVSVLALDAEEPGVGQRATPADHDHRSPVPTRAPAITLADVSVPTFSLPASHACEALERIGELDDATGPQEIGTTRVLAGASLEYFLWCAHAVRWMLSQQRFVPSLMQTPSGDLRGLWQPWLSDEATAQRLNMLVRTMPPAARACMDEFRHHPWRITESFLTTAVDSACRSVLQLEGFEQTIENHDPVVDQHVAWLSGLLTRQGEVHVPLANRQDLARRVRAWIGGLEERGASASWRLLLRVIEPDVLGMAPDASPPPEDSAWDITFHLQAIDAPHVIADATDIWLMTGDHASVLGRRIDQPHDLLLKELARAARIYRRIDVALEQGEPDRLSVNTRQAYEFLREIRPLLIEQGFGVDAPAWWDTPAARLGAKLRIHSDEQGPVPAAPGAVRPRVGLSSLVHYTWEISVGDATLSLQEFESLASRKVPLVRVNGRWVEVRPEDVQAAIAFIRENPGGEIRLSDAMRLAYAGDVRSTGIPVVGLEATGWVQAFMNSEAAAKQLEVLPPPREFHGTLRPYQARGVSWMMFQEQLGFGVCLADDMGLGKTIQLLALLSYEREGAESPTSVPPTLLLVPMSVVGNWQHETRRFCPQLRVLTHHGPERALGAAFLEKVRDADLVITTYALAHRDRELLSKVKWHRVVLDEAQYIKNAQSKQSQAVRSLESSTRVALTGTPVENRLAELWSIMDFLNPGYLGGATSFRTRFAVPIERYRDKHKGDQLRGLIRPFVLRRLKTDPTVVADLPAKVESREFSHLTSEQAQLYETCVKRMLQEVDQAEGMQRRGIVLSSLIRLKQICNHPAHALKDWDPGAPGHAPPDPARSGKCIRLLEMLDEIISEGDQALVFTQFRQMGHLLEAMIRARLASESHHASAGQRGVLFIHGGVSQPQRQLIIEQFQKGDGRYPVLLLSLRAGGVGLNLTAATHVFHFDRWWNPAVENQATDRAYRIGQTRTVQVHKFVVRGTLEERIDQMIESKTELAENIIGQGEAWLSELTTSQLRDILTLRNDAIDDIDSPT